MKPKLGTYPEYFQKYIDTIKEDNLLTALDKESIEAIQLFQTFSEEKSLYSYSEGKWTIKELIQHVIDTERIFSYRALVYSRKDSTPLPSFDENSYAKNSQANLNTLDELIEEFFAVRKSTQLLFKSFSEEQLLATGVMGGKSTSVVAIGFIIVGHCNHHLQILKERYLN